MKRPTLAGVATALLVLLGGLGVWSRAPRPIHGPASWPSPAHPLGVDAMGRDFLAVLGAGTADFALPGLAAAAVLLLAFAVAARWTLNRPSVGVRASMPAGLLALASPPRLLIVMVAMLLLPEPNPWIAAAVVAALYLPVAMDEVLGRLADLVDREVIGGLVSHGLPLGHIAVRHLLLGHLREAALRHAAALFAQVALTQVALSYIFGGSATTAGLGVSWGMEFRRLAALLPTSSTICPADGACPEAVAAFQAGCLLAAALVVFAGLGRLAQPAEPEVTA